ncbi:hypothetical protein [Nocardia araoensis]|nr:hypothetical protein [Nocardia araoensis]
MVVESVVDPSGHECLQLGQGGWSAVDAAAGSCKPEAIEGAFAHA